MILFWGFFGLFIFSIIMIYAIIRWGKRDKIYKNFLNHYGITVGLQKIEEYEQKHKLNWWMRLWR